MVDLVRQELPNVSTLAIGDGANDVSMINAAHVGNNDITLLFSTNIVLLLFDLLSDNVFKVLEFEEKKELKLKGRVTMQCLNLDAWGSYCLTLEESAIERIAS